MKMLLFCVMFCAVKTNEQDGRGTSFVRSL